MSNVNSPDDVAERRMRTGKPWLAVCWFVLAGIGLVGTWTLNIRFALAGGGDYLGSWFANFSAASAAVDLIVMTAAASLVYWRERWVISTKRPLALLFIPLSILVAVSFAFPLFMALREVRLIRRGPSQSKR